MKSDIFACDFETTVYEGQTYTECWSCAYAKLYSDEQGIFGNIKDFFEYFFSLKKNCLLYFHNLKFDGSFIIDWLLSSTNIKQSIKFKTDNLEKVVFNPKKEMKNNEFIYLIDERGGWYSITIKKNNVFIEIRDSLKLLPFSLKQIAKSFKTNHQKLEMEYVGFRYANCPISKEEKEYILNDVFVLKEALEIMFNEKHNKITIGSCCLAEFKQTFLFKEDFETMFPRLEEIVLPADYGSANVDEYIRKSYKGGWCYLKKEKANRIYKNGITLDVNSLYPYVMHSSSGDYFPIGKPEFFKSEIPSFLTENNELYSKFYYFVRLKCRFKLRDKMLPTLQIKNSILYKGNEWLETSDVEYAGDYYRYLKDESGKLVDTCVTLTMTCTDFEIFKKHYDLFDLEILDGCYFRSCKGIFDEYINKYMSIKEKEKGAKRTLAKLFLNNLYGKLATSSKSTYKYCFLDNEKVLRFLNVYDNSKKTLHIACGSAITSYARSYTINHAQANYDTFIYSDTDSIHLSVQDDIKMCKIDDKKLGFWKKEKIWDIGLFVRQKTYIESLRINKSFNILNKKKEVIKTLNFKKNDIDVKCAGMTQACKDYFIQELNDKEKTLSDFKVGYSNNKKLRVKRIRGGIVLVNSTFKIR